MESVDEGSALDGMEKARIGRRALIKGAAAAGAAAWTAPVILDSLASPAAAQSFIGCRRIRISVSGCNALPTSSSSWATTCNSGLSSVSATCGKTITNIPDDIDTLANLGITRTACGTFNTTLKLSKTNCSWVAGEAHSTVSGCNGSSSINNATAGNRLISFSVGSFVDDYFLVATCT